MEVNGLRVGLVTGELPAEVRAVLEAPPPHKIDPATIVIPDGDNTLVDLAPSRPELNLLLSRQGSVGGKRYQDANGHLRITATRQEDTGVALKIVPELHFGPVQDRWSAAPGAAGRSRPSR